VNANYRCMNVAAEVFKGKIVGTQQIVRLNLFPFKLLIDDSNSPSESAPVVP